MLNVKKHVYKGSNGIKNEELGVHKVRRSLVNESDKAGFLDKILVPIETG